MKNIFSLITAFLSLTFVVGAFFAAPVSADHTWGNYHWARTANPFLLKLGDNLTSNWDPYLATTSTDWTASNVLDTEVIPGSTNPKRCAPTGGRIEVCNSAYGKNGWLGIAQIWVSGDHIGQGTVKLNDTYFKSATYNTPAWRNLVMCQEVGHTFGLDHQDEIFNNANLNTCMDYTNNPLSNQHPNLHDYEQLDALYAHLDVFTTIGQSVSGSAQGDLMGRSEWGTRLKDNGHVATFIRDLGRGQKVLTHVIWALE